MLWAVAPGLSWDLRAQKEGSQVRKEGDRLHANVSRRRLALPLSRTFVEGTGWGLARA